MKVVYTAEVLRELRAARKWYNRRAPGVGERLVDLVDEKIGDIARAPESFPRDQRDPIARRARVPKYPVLGQGPRVQLRGTRYDVLSAASVFTLRCTARLLRRLNVPVTADRPAPSTLLGDWYANLLHVGRLQLVLAVSENAFLPVVVQAAPGASLVARLREAMATQLGMLGIPAEAIRAEEQAMRDVVYGKTANRQVLGILVDFAKALPFYLESRGSLGAAARTLAETPCTPLFGSRASSPDLATPVLFGVDARASTGVELRSELRWCPTVALPSK